MMNRLRLKALRLVGFHNYNDELIEVHGDLFVIGINESGKTTILDALHLVLSGGQSFDLNAAAKMAGRRDEGRSLQGIILRADLAGNPHPDRKGGSITYAVAEFEQDIGKPPVTLIFGASAVDMNARTRKWGVITSKHAADLPLVKEQEDGSFRIVNRDELAQSLDDPILTDMSKYRTAIAFGDGIAVVSTSGRLDVIDTGGNPVGSIDADYVCGPFAEGRVVTRSSSTPIAVCWCRSRKATSALGRSAPCPRSRKAAWWCAASATRNSSRSCRRS